MQAVANVYECRLPRCPTAPSQLRSCLSTLAKFRHSKTQSASTPTVLFQCSLSTINMGLGGSSSILFCAFHIAVASSQRYSPPADQAYTIETDLQSLLQDTTISQEKELSETLAWYQKLPSEGSCVQLAAMKLMSECKLLDNPSDFAKAHPDLYLVCLN
jgi:hypothetical protein